MEDKNIALLIGGFVLLILGIALLTPSAELINDVTDKTGVGNEAIDISSARNASGAFNSTLSRNFTITNVPDSWKIQDCLITSAVYGNSSDDYTITTDYLFDTKLGVVTVVIDGEADTNGVNSTLIDYTYCADDYLNSQWQRTVLDLVPGFVAIALLLISIGIFFGIARSEGILDNL